MIKTIFFQQIGFTKLLLNIFCANTKIYILELIQWVTIVTNRKSNASILSFKNEKFVLEIIQQDIRNKIKEGNVKENRANQHEQVKICKKAHSYI